jgi:CrcB protein
MPWSTLIVNVIGSLVIGLYAALTEPGGRLAASPAQRLFMMAGVCGGFTTFSMFTAEVLDSMNRGEWKLVAWLLSASVGAWLIGAAAGYAFGKQLNRLSRAVR